MSRLRTLSVTSAVAAALVLSGCGAGQGPRAAACTTTVPGSAPVVLDPEQTANAATIAAVGHRLGLADHAVTVALATAMQESRLRNLAYGDRDSLGLFQQRPSQGWGTPAQVATPTYAAAAFYSHLVDVPGWADLPVTVAAQAVQRSAFPEAYAAHEGAARSLARATTGQVPAALACAHLTGTGPLRAAELRAAAADELGPGALAPSGAGDLWGAASWVVAHADAYGVSQVAAGGRRWSADTGAWTVDGAASQVLTYR